MTVLTVRHPAEPDKTLHLETELRALRHALWLSQFLAQDLHLHGLCDRITPLLQDTDRLIGEVELL